MAKTLCLQRRGSRFAPSEGTRSHMAQLKIRQAEPRPGAAAITKTRRHGAQRDRLVPPGVLGAEGRETRSGEEWPPNTHQLPREKKADTESPEGAAHG